MKDAIEAAAPEGVTAKYSSANNGEENDSAAAIMIIFIPTSPPNENTVPKRHIQEST